MTKTKFQLPTDADRPHQADPPEVDPRALEAFAAGARERRGARESPPPPWDRFDPKAKPRHNVSVRLNDYQLEMLRYLSEVLDISQQKILRRQVVPAIEAMAEEAFGKGGEQ